MVWIAAYVSIFILPDFLSMMSPIVLKLLSTRGPWKIDETALTTLNTTGYFFETLIHHVKQSLSSLFESRAEGSCASTNNFHTSKSYSSCSSDVKTLTKTVGISLNHFSTNLLGDVTILGSMTENFFNVSFSNGNFF